MTTTLTKTVTITVTQEDIDTGVPCVTRCPVALAVLRAFPEAVEASVGLGHFSVRRDGEPWPLEGYDLPSVATSWISRFDSEGAVEPFSFEVAA